LTDTLVSAVGITTQSDLVASARFPVSEVVDGSCQHLVAH
jgi:hypothetical protein